MAPEIPAAERLMVPRWALERVPGLEHGAAPRLLQSLAGGSVNRVFRVETGTGSFVLRLNGAAWRRPGVDRARELLLHQAAAAADIAPAILAAAPEAEGLLITQYHQGRSWCAEDFADPRALVRLGERLAALHALPPPGVPVFDPWRVALAYVQSIEALPEAASNARERAAVLSRLEPCCVTLAGLATDRLAIVHGDLAGGNLLQGERLWLLDWEYAQRSHPVLDLACVLAYYPQAGEYRAELLAAAGLQMRALDGLLSEGEYLYRALSWLWHLARGETTALP